MNNGAPLCLLSYEKGNSSVPLWNVHALARDPCVMRGPGSDPAARRLHAARIGVENRPDLHIWTAHPGIRW
ncbi:hypothetical protein GCM10009799_35510 [Nocardiopsis rhodophaea]|uniref:Uncharacterized protein n=1 Tax=Nocardiopsis rhodophaea TaxID=280238 RepID=A0ABP5ETH2_9ACTN